MKQGKAYRCELLGGFRLFGQNGQEIRIPVAKGAAIIAYLILSEERSVSRSFLVGLLWSERSEAAARTALRQCLHQMKIRLDTSALDFIVITQNTVQLATQDLETDIGMLAREGDGGNTGSRKLDIDRLLYGFEDLDPSFSDWLLDQRRHQRTVICKGLMHQLESSQDDNRRLIIADALHQLDPCLEVAARPLIEKYIRTGNIVELLSVYQRLWNALEESWEEEPSHELQEIVGNARVLFGDNLPTLSKGEFEARIRRYVSVLAICLKSKQGLALEIHRKSYLPFLQNAKQLLAESGAVLISDDDDFICALFGLPRAHENDAQNAIKTALKLREIFFEHLDNELFDLSIGLDAGFVGMPRRGEELAKTPVANKTVANAKNLALENSELTSIQATWRMVRRLQHLFDIHRMCRLNLDDDSVRINGHSEQAEQQFLENVHGLIGRVPFIAALRTAWEETRNEGLQIICLQGPAGIGKTRLAREFLLDSNAEMPVLAAIRCNRYDRSVPLEPVHTLLRILTGQYTKVDGTPKELLSQLTKAIASLSGALFVDDWHWVDDASRSVFQELIHSIQDRPILLILTARDASFDDGLVRTSHLLQVPPMNANEAERRAEQVLGRPIDTALKSKIFEKSGGNPLYLEEICRALNPLEKPKGSDVISKAFSADLHALIASRIDHLDAEDTKVIFAISVHGEVVDQELLTSVLGFKVPQARLERLCALDLLRPDLSGTRLQFKHGITRDVAYDMISEPDRTTLHARYFNVFQTRSRAAGSNDFVENLALHAKASGKLIDAIEFSEQAGDKALAASSLGQAERQYHAALTLIEKLDQETDWRARWLSIALRWARPCVYAASIDQLPLLKKAQTIAAKLGDDAKLCEILYWTGYNLIVQGEYAQAIIQLNRSKSLAKTLGLARLEIETMAILGCALTLKSQYGSAERVIKIALGAKDQHPVRKGHVPVTSVYLQSILALINGERGHFDTAEKKLETALERVSEFKHEIESSILSTGTTVLLWRGQWEKAREFAKRARQRAEHVGAPYMIGTSRCLYCYSDWKITTSTDCLDELEHTANWLDVQGMRLFLTLIYGWLSDALADAGRFEDATIIAFRVLDRTKESGECLGTSMACRSLARSAMAPGGSGFQTAQNHMKAARYWAQHRGAEHEHGVCALLEAQIYEQENQPEAAQAYLMEAIAIFERLGMTSFLETARSISKSN